MILWILLFVLICIISFLLALASMANYQELPQKSESDYALFLIRKTPNLTAQILDDLYKVLEKRGLVLSFERLIKGRESSLVVFGPKELLVPHFEALDLLELEDYTDVPHENINGFELGTKGKSSEAESYLKGFFKHFPPLNPEESIWWQLILKSRKDKTFEIAPRVIIYSEDKARRESITRDLHHLAEGFLTKVPKPFSSSQVLSFYKLRSFIKNPHDPILSSKQVLELL